MLSSGRKHPRLLLKKYSKWRTVAKTRRTRLRRLRCANTSSVWIQVPPDSVTVLFLQMSKLIEDFQSRCTYGRRCSTIVASESTTFDHVTTSVRLRHAYPPLAFVLHASPPNPFSLALVAVAIRLTLPSHSQVPSSRRTPILMVKETRIAQDMSTDTTNTRHFKNLVAPRRIRRAWPLASLIYVSVWKGYCRTKGQLSLFIHSLMFLSS